MIRGTDTGQLHGAMSGASAISTLKAAANDYRVLNTQLEQMVKRLDRFHSRLSGISNPESAERSDRDERAEPYGILNEIDEQLKLHHLMLNQLNEVMVKLEEIA